MRLALKSCLRIPVRFRRRETLAIYTGILQTTRILSGAHHGHHGSTYACQLTHRSLLRVEGEEGKRFLQGLVTANMEEERETGTAFYSMMLNAQGRILYDIIFYTLSEGKYLLECDLAVRDDVIKTLRKYALRAKVSFSAADTELSVWALFPRQPALPPPPRHILTPDPRYREFGYRAVLPRDLRANLEWPHVEMTEIEAYHIHRFQSGIPEGSIEIAVGNCLPLEFNLDYMSGVSFNKGCYLGQELTARTFHTGVVRKRVMPIILERSPSSSIPSATSVRGKGPKSAGKLLTHRGLYGLALLRLAEIPKGSLAVVDKDGNEIPVSTQKPDFWPKSDTENISS